jgi:hypothetical protein
MSAAAAAAAHNPPATAAAPAPPAVPVFFSRNGLAEGDLETCLRFAAEKFPGRSLEVLDGQGGCSFTLVIRAAAATVHWAGESEVFGLNRAGGQEEARVGFDARRDSLFKDKVVREKEKPWIEDFADEDPEENDIHDEDDTIILQLRLQKHALPIDMAQAARSFYSPLAPRVKDLGQVPVGFGVHLQALALSCIPGQCYRDVQPKTRHLDPPTLSRLRSLLKSLSGFFARNWRTGPPDRVGLATCSGKVGRSLMFRLGTLARHLPSHALREKAAEVERLVEEGMLDDLPCVLTHGDLLPSNIMVDPATWIVKGYVDWAEAEWLPYGMCFYGLEHMLGWVEMDGSGETRGPRFVYYDNADELRAEFWEILQRQVPEIRDEEIKAKILLVRAIGIFLWKGFAWDDGAIDRVVNATDDAEEIVCLEAFLGIKSNMSCVGGRHDSMMMSDGDHGPGRC